MPPTTLTTRTASQDDVKIAAFRLAVQQSPWVLAHWWFRTREFSHMSESFHGPLFDYMHTTPWAKNLYLLPRDHMKTTLITVVKNAHRILRNPQIRILLASNKAQAAESMLIEIKAILTEPMVVRAFPDVLYADPARQAEKWTASQITVKRKRATKEATIETIGTEGELTSKHYDHASFDDLVGLENSQTRDQLLATIDWWRTAQSLLDPKATQDITGTPWAHMDLYGWLIEQWSKHGMKLGIYRQPCWQTTQAPQLLVDARGNLVPDEFRLDAEGRPIPSLPERFTYESIEDKRKDLGGVRFAAQWLLHPGDDDEAVFPRKKAKIVPRASVPPLEELWTVMAVDPAISEKNWADYTAVAVVGFDTMNRMWVLDLRRGRWPESKTISTVYDGFRRTPGIVSIGFEAVGFAKLYRREFTRAGETRGYLPIHSLERDTKKTKNTRILSLEPLWSSGELFLVEDIEALDDFLDEAERFRRYRESLHDDMLDALADTLQMRARPSEKPKEWLIDDPAVIERLEFEDSALARRPDLDRASLRMQWTMQKRREQIAREVEMQEVGSGSGEFL